MAKIDIWSEGKPSGRVNLDTGMAAVEISDSRGVIFKDKNGEILMIREGSNGGFQLHYRRPWSSENDDTEFDAGIVQFKNGVIKRPGEEGYDYHGD